MAKLLLFIFVAVVSFGFFNTADAQSSRLRYLCMENGGQYSFTLQPSNQDCRSDFLGEEWSNLSFSREQIVDYNIVDVVKERDSIKGWWRVLLSNPTFLEDGDNTQYDQIMSLTRFYCDRRQGQTIDVAYIMGGEVVRQNRFPPEEIRPNTIYDALYKKFCERMVNVSQIPSSYFIASYKELSILSLLLIFQVLFVLINWWVYNSYTLQQKYNHPEIFRNMMTKNLLLTVPWILILGAVVVAFLYDIYPWFFLFFTTIFWLALGYKGYIAHKRGAGKFDFGLDGILDKMTPPKKELPSISKEWLMDKISHQEILSGAIYEKSQGGEKHGDTKVDDRYSPFPDSPSASEEWIQFQNRIHENDEIWTFSSMKAGRKNPFHWVGVCLIRNGEIIDCVADELHILYRSDN